MLNRKERRAAAHAQRKADRKAGFPISQPTPQSESVKAESILQDIPEPGAPFPSLKSTSPEQPAANQANAKLSTGAKSPETKAISAQNHTIHGLARHHATKLKFLLDETSADFEALHHSLFDEHQPTTETEIILVTAMAESHFLSQRAQRLLDLCIEPAKGAITDDKKFSLYLRYQTTYRRAFHKSLNDLVKLRSERRKATIGFEAQKIAKEKHEMKKQSHYWDVLKKDGQACHQITLNLMQSLKARKEFPGFEAQYEAELAKNGLQTDMNHVATAAA